MFTYVHLRFAPHPQKYDHFFIVIIRYRVVLQKNIAESTCICDHVWNIMLNRQHISRLTADACVRLIVKTDVQIGRKNAQAVYTCI